MISHFDFLAMVSLLGLTSIFLILRYDFFEQKDKLDILELSELSQLLLNNSQNAEPAKCFKEKYHKTSFLKNIRCPIGTGTCKETEKE